jgi:hypothetical protein
MKHIQYKSKLVDILKQKIFFFIENDITVIYINNKPLSKFHLKKSFCFVQFVADNIENETAILSIVTNIKYRGSGLASFLLMIVAEYSDNIITLDDASDNCFCKNNLYLNNGFQYLTKGEPEMEATRDDVLSNLQTFYSKYRGNLFFK